MGGAQSTHAKGPGATKNKTPCATGELILFDSDIPPTSGLALLFLLIAVKGVSRLLKTEDDDDINELIQRRREAFHRKARGNIFSKLKSIVDKAKESYEHDPLHPSRPYGLAVGMEGLQRHIWDLIFVHVNELDTIVSLREVCVMFRDLLESKYVAARLPGIAALCLERKLIPWELKISSWVPTLSSLRGLSNATKISVDQLLDRGLVEKRDCLFYQYYRMEFRRLPYLMFGASDAHQARLQKALDSLEVEEFPKDSFPVKALVFDECRADNLPFDLQNVRDALHILLEKIGRNITSFRYWTTNESPYSVYENLRRFVAFMPNLKELMVIFIRPGIGPVNVNNVGSFPTCPKLKHYAEGPHGFGFPFINEIFKANPTIKEALLGETPSHDLEVENLMDVLDTLQLKKFNCMCLPTIKFLEHRFPWADNLTSLTLWDCWDNTPAPASPVIPSETLFKFLSSFKNLKILNYMSSRVRYTGGYLNLPLLQELSWQIVPGFQTLEFLKPVENLKWLELNISACPPEFKRTCKMLEFLGKWHIPKLFPGLKKVSVKTNTIENYKTIWKS